MTTCSMDSCERKAVARGYCPMHYQQARKNGSFQTSVRPNEPTTASVCSEPDCSRPTAARGLCAAHFAQKFAPLRKAAIPIEPGKLTLCHYGKCQEIATIDGYCATHRELVILEEPGSTRGLLTHVPPRSCRAFGCEEPAVGLGFCSRHYDEWGKKLLFKTEPE